MNHLTQPRTVLRGSTLVSAPFTLAGLVCVALCALSVTWVFGTDTPTQATGWVTGTAFGLLGAGLLAAARGCRVVLEAGHIADQVAWYTVWSAETSSIVEVRVRSGPWRTFETEETSGRRRVLLGAGPVQFPANLLPDAAERDLAAIDILGGSVRS
jgi:hypothetical protein